MLCPKINGKGKNMVCDCKKSKGIWVADDKVCVCPDCGKQCILGKVKNCFEDKVKINTGLKPKPEPTKASLQEFSKYPTSPLCRVIGSSFSPHEFMSRDGNNCDICMLMARAGKNEPTPKEKHVRALIIEVRGKVDNNTKEIAKYVVSIKKQALKDGYKAWVYKETMTGDNMNIGQPGHYQFFGDVKFMVDKK